MARDIFFKPSPIGLVTAGLLAFGAVAGWAGPKGEITVRHRGDAKITIDGDLRDWPLDQFKAAAQQPLFPEGQNAVSTSAKGDHLVFDKRRVGLFNDTAPDAFGPGDSDFGAATYFAYDAKYLYILSVVIDDVLRDDRDTSVFGTSGFLNDGFEFFLDTRGDSNDCISDDGFPNVDQVEPNADDFQVTVGLNSTFKPPGSGSSVLGARQTIERGGNPALIGDEKGGPGGIYRDQLDAIGGPDIAARKIDDLRLAGAKNPEIAAKPNVKFSGYAIEMRIPLRGRIPNMTSDHAMGFELFWRDVDKIASDPEGKDPGAGGGDISWASWGQSTTVPCTESQKSLFTASNWGQLVFDKANPLLPIPAGKPTVLFVTSVADNMANADGDLVELLESHGFGVVAFTANGSTPEGLREAARGKSAVYISETIGSTSVVDPPSTPTGIFSLKDTDVPVVSAEAYMYDNADWVTKDPQGNNDFTQWGNSGRTEVAETPINDGRDSLIIRKADHPIAKGFGAKVKVHHDLYSLNFGLPSPDADVVASIQPDGTYPTIFVYEKGDKLSDGSIAPNKRIGVFLAQNAAPDFNTPLSFTNITADGRALLVSTIAYAAGVTTSDGLIKSVTATGGDLAPDVVYSGQTYTDAAGATALVPHFGEDAFAFIDRTHQWNGAATNLALPSYLVGRPYVMTRNNNRDNADLKIKIELSGPGTVYLLVDNRVGDPDGGDATNPPNIGPGAPNMTWVSAENGWFPVRSGYNRTLDVSKPDEVGYDESATAADVGPGVSLNQWGSVYAKRLGDAGTVELAAQLQGRNMYGAVVSKDEPPGGIPLAPPPPAEKINITSIRDEGTALSLAWTGGAGPFMVQKKASLSDPAWMNVKSTSSRSAMVVNDGSNGYFRIADNAQGTVTQLTVLLNGAAEKPAAVETPATGAGTLSLTGNALTYSVSYRGLKAAATAAHIHGPAASDLATGVLVALTGASGTQGVLSGTITLTDEQKGHILAGRTYVNIHSSALPGGEIRGQIAPAEMKATLSGAAERPTPVTTLATGSGTLSIVGNVVSYDISYTGLGTAASAAHIHGPATAEQAAEVLKGLVAPTGTSGKLTGSVTLDSTQLNALIDGKTYINIHTSGNPGGELRGQVLP